MIMSKGLEALNEVRENLDFEGCLDFINEKRITDIKQALQRLEAIDSAKPSEAFNYVDRFINEMTYCLEHPKEYAKGYEKEIFYKYKYSFETVVKQALIKAQEQDFNYKNIVIPFFDELTNVLGTNDIDEMLDKIKEQEKVLKIIIKKNVMIYALKVSKTVDDYNDFVSTDEQLTQEEFDTLKRYCEQ